MADAARKLDAAEETLKPEGGDLRTPEVTKKPELGPAWTRTVGEAKKAAEDFSLDTPMRVLALETRYDEKLLANERAEAEADANQAKQAAADMEAAGNVDIKNLTEALAEAGSHVEVTDDMVDQPVAATGRTTGGRSGLDLVVGGTPERQAQAAAVLEQAFDDQETEKIIKRERPKNPEDLENIAMINEDLAALRKEFGLEPFEVPAENVHIVPKKHWSFPQNPGVIDPLNQQVAVVEKPSRLEAAKTIYHELAHFNSFMSVETVDGGAKMRRFGLVGFKEGQKENFGWLNEAVTENLAKSFIERQRAHPAFAEDAQREAELRKTVPKAISDDPEFFAFYPAGVSTDGKQVYNNVAFGYQKERQAFAALTQALSEKDPARFPNPAAAERAFTKAMFDGKMLDLARSVEGVYGKGAFRKLAEAKDADEALAIIQGLPEVEAAKAPELADMSRAELKAEEKRLLATYEALLEKVSAEAPAEKAAYKKAMKNGGAMPESTAAGKALNEAFMELKRVRAAIAEAPTVAAARPETPVRTPPSIEPPPTPPARAKAPPVAEPVVEPVRAYEAKEDAGFDSVVAKYQKSFEGQHTEGDLVGLVSMLENRTPEDMLTDAEIAGVLSKDDVRAVIEANKIEEFKGAAVANLTKLLEQTKAAVPAEKLPAKEKAPTPKSVKNALAKYFRNEPSQMPDEVLSRAASMTKPEELNAYRDELRKTLDGLGDPASLLETIERRAQLTPAEINVMDAYDKDKSQKLLTELYTNAIGIVEAEIAKRNASAPTEKPAPVMPAPESQHENVEPLEEPLNKTLGDALKKAAEGLPDRPKREDVTERLATYFENEPPLLEKEITERMAILSPERANEYLSDLRTMRDGMDNKEIQRQALMNKVELSKAEIAAMTDYDLEKSRKLLKEMYTHAVQVAEAAIAAKNPAAAPEAMTPPTPEAPRPVVAEPAAEQKAEAGPIDTNKAVEAYLASATEPIPRRALLKKMQPGKISAKAFLKDMTTFKIIDEDTGKKLLEDGPAVANMIAQVSAELAKRAANAK